jgi:NTP pyrophosphatase (non-canonical NTP hydrolase)
MSDLLLSDLRTANVARLPEFRDRQGRICHPPIEGQPPGYDWALSQWSNAVCGELGEAANLIKKIERGDFTLDEARAELADELCDVLTYLDILAHRAGINLADATISKWNRVSERVGSGVRLAIQSAPQPFLPLGCDCYPGCWGDHSAAWPSISFASEAACLAAYRIVNQEGLADYGSVVCMPTALRFASEVRCDAVAARLRAEPTKTV